MSERDVNFMSDRVTVVIVDAENYSEVRRVRRVDTIVTPPLEEPAYNWQTLPRGGKPKPAPIAAARPPPARSPTAAAAPVTPAKPPAAPTVTLPVSVVSARTDLVFGSDAPAGARPSAWKAGAPATGSPTWGLAPSPPAAIVAAAKPAAKPSAPTTVAAAPTPAAPTAPAAAKPAPKPAARKRAAKGRRKTGGGGRGSQATAAVAAGLARMADAAAGASIAARDHKQEERDEREDAEADPRPEAPLIYRVSEADQRDLGNMFPHLNLVPVEVPQAHTHAFGAIQRHLAMAELDAHIRKRYPGARVGSVYGYAPRDLPHGWHAISPGVVAADVKRLAQAVAACGPPRTGRDGCATAPDSNWCMCDPFTCTCGPFDVYVVWHATYYLTPAQVVQLSHMARAGLAFHGMYLFRDYFGRVDNRYRYYSTLRGSERFVRMRVPGSHEYSHPTADWMQLTQLRDADRGVALDPELHFGDFVVIASRVAPARLLVHDAPPRNVLDALTSPGTGAISSRPVVIAAGTDPTYNEAIAALTLPAHSVHIVPYAPNNGLVALVPSGDSRTIWAPRSFIGELRIAGLAKKRDATLYTSLTNIAVSMARKLDWPSDFIPDMIDAAVAIAYVAVAGSLGTMKTLIGPQLPVAQAYNSQLAEPGSRTWTEAAAAYAPAVAATLRQHTQAAVEARTTPAGPGLAHIDAPHVNPPHARPPGTKPVDTASRDGVGSVFGAVSNYAAAFFSPANLPRPSYACFACKASSPRPADLPQLPTGPAPGDYRSASPILPYETWRATGRRGSGRRYYKLRADENVRAYTEMCGPIPVVRVHAVDRVKAHATTVRWRKHEAARAEARAATTAPPKPTAGDAHTVPSAAIFALMATLAAPKPHSASAGLAAPAAILLVVLFWLLGHLVTSPGALYRPIADAWAAATAAAAQRGSEAVLTAAPIWADRALSLTRAAYATACAAAARAPVDQVADAAARALCRAGLTSYCPVAPWWQHPAIAVAVVLAACAAAFAVAKRRPARPPRAHMASVSPVVYYAFILVGCFVSLPPLVALLSFSATVYFATCHISRLIAEEGFVRPPRMFARLVVGVTHHRAALSDPNVWGALLAPAVEEIMRHFVPVPVTIAIIAKEASDRYREGPAAYLQPVALHLTFYFLGLPAALAAHYAWNIMVYVQSPEPAGITTGVIYAVRDRAISIAAVTVPPPPARVDAARDSASALAAPAPAMGNVSRLAC